MSVDEFDELTAQSRARVGQTLGGGKWTLTTLLGVGGMAAVYAAAHRNGARSAIKILHPHVAASPEAKTRFLREAYIANAVGHAGAVGVLDDDLDPSGCPYLVMEILEGEAVDARAARQGGRLTIPEVVAIADQTLAVLEAAHAKNIVHRDIKPENLFLTKTGALKVLDFGIARLREDTTLSRTKTGMLMGTPAYMAPEQAMARWSDVDGRTDLWAVGATMYTLLTGQFVHDGETNNEMLVHAATQPARSLARALPGAPVALVAVVDRALEYDKERRYPDAASMRAELASLRPGAPTATLAAGAAAAVRARAATELGPGGPPPQERSSGAPVADRSRPPAGAAAPPPPPIDRSRPPAAAPPSPQSASAAATLLAGRVDPGRGATLDTSASAADVEAMRELFASIEKGFVAKSQYGLGHPETTRRLERIAAHATAALARAEDGLVWGVTPYAFVAGAEILWEPEAPLNRIPYQLFADGVRALGVAPGLRPEELSELLRILAIDPASELAPEDDLVTLLWDAGFEHVFHHAIDSFAEGDQAARAQFEREREAVFALARFDTSDAIGECWTASRRRAAAVQADASPRRLMQAMASRQLETDAEAMARAGRLRVAADSRGGAELVRVDAAAREVLAARMQPDAAGIGERFVAAAAHAFVDASGRNEAERVTAPLRATVDTLARETPASAVDFVCALCAAVDVRGRPADAERLRATLAGALVSPATMRALLGGARAASDEGATPADGRIEQALEMLLGYLDGTYVPAVLEAAVDIAAAKLRQVLLRYVERNGRGHEAAIGALLPTAEVELGLELVRLLVALGTPAAREAIAHAARSPHAVVRIEALGNIEGVSSERVRVELRALLEDREPTVRVAALRAMATYNIRVAGPFLVLRIRSSGFDALPLEERREALATLCALAPNRAESVALELLSEARLLSSEAHEQTRELAADTLGRVASGAEAEQALTEAAKRRLRGSERVRIAAARALEQIASRAAAPVAAGSRSPRA